MNENAQYAYRYLQEKYKLTPAQAAGVVGNLMQESGLSTGAKNPGDGSDGSDSVGIAQWNGTRARALRDFAGENVGDLDTQLDFMMHELQTKETGAWKQLKNADDVHSATAAFIGYERPQGYTRDNPTNGHGWENRYKYAATLHGMSPEEIAQAKATQSAPTETREAVITDNAKPAEDKRWVKVPDEIAGVKTENIVKGFKGFSDYSKQAEATAAQMNANRAKGGMLQNKSDYSDILNLNAQAPVSSGLLGSAVNAPVDPREQAELERKRKMMAMLGGGLGGLGGLGNFA